MADQGKVSGFRLPPETLEKLDELQVEGVIKNRTDGVVKAIDRLYIEEDDRDNPFLRMLSSLIHTRRFIDNWVNIDEDTRLVFIHDESGEEDYVRKIDDYRAEVVRSVDHGKITAVITFEPDGYYYDSGDYQRIVPIEGMQKNRDRVMEKTKAIGRKRKIDSAIVDENENNEASTE